MGKKIWLAAICTLVLPFLYSGSPGDLGTVPAPFVVVAVAGHSTGAGTWCDCDPVEGDDCPCSVSRIVVSPSDSDKPLTKRHASNRPFRGSRGELDFGTGALWLGLGLLLWRYMRNSIF